MRIEKTWHNKPAKEDNFIVCTDQKICRLRVGEFDYGIIQNELSKGVLNAKFTCLPIRYFKKVEYREDDDKLRLYYGKDSEEAILVSDTATRKDIFDYLSANTNPKKVEIKTPSFFQRTKKPLIALCVLIVLFSCVYMLIEELKQGHQYEGAGLGGLILGLAHLGLSFNLSIFIPLMSIALLRIVVLNRRKSEVFRLSYG